MKKSLSEHEIINGARDLIEGGDCLGASGNTGGSGGDPVYLISGKMVCYPQNTCGVPRCWAREICQYHC